MSAARPTPVDRVRAELAERMSSFPLVSGAPVLLVDTWVLPHLTAAQIRERKAIEKAMQAGELRGMPTCFGELT